MPGFLVGVGKPGDVAERSPSVISANLKEDMLLQKKLVVLNRSEKSVVHQIKVDQKVVYKRFQAKLTCSKLAHARLMGNKEQQMQLRAKNLRGLNTDIAGNSDEEYAFLEKLEQRPCTSSSITSRYNMKPEDSSTSFSNQNVVSVGTPVQKTPAQALHGRPLSARQSALNVGKSDPLEVLAKMRPATTKGTRVSEEFLFREDLLKNAEKVRLLDEPKMFGNFKNKLSSVKSKGSCSVSENKTNKGDADEKGTESNGSTITGKAEDKPNVAFMENLQTLDTKQTNDSDPSSPKSPKQYSRRASRAADFFQAEDKIDLVALRLKQARALDFTDSVQKFCKELDEMKCTQNSPDVDYYSVRLQMSLDQAQSKSRVHVPGTPEAEHKRCMGNIFVRSLTVPKLNWNCGT